MDRRQEWMLRCSHEASLREDNSFVTLTYDDQHLPAFGSLVRSDLQRFLKRIRRALGPLRYFGCGEYGTASFRPHYHLLLFGLRPPSLVPYGRRTFTSSAVSELWPFGSHLIGDVTAASSAYVAGYSMKKLKSTLVKESFYQVSDPETGEVLLEREPEFPCMSLKPGVGQGWYDRWKSDLASGVVVHEGRRYPVPRFYEQQYREDFPLDAEARELRRVLAARARDPIHRWDPERLRAREVVAKSALAHLARDPFSQEV